MIIIKGRLDGSGSQISKYLILEALFEKFNITFYIDYVNSSRRPNLKRDNELIEFFKIRLISRNNFPKNLIEIDSLCNFINKKIYLDNNDYYLIDYYWESKLNQFIDINDLFTKTYVTKRKKLLPKYEVSILKTEFTNIGIHIRRGDVSKTNKHKNRYIGDEYYLEIIKKFNKEYNNAYFYVFSDELFNGDINLFKNINNCTILLTKRDFKKSYNVLRDWKILINIDILIIGASSFAYVPAFLNENKVFYIENMNMKTIILNKWNSMNDYMNNYTYQWK